MRQITVLKILAWLGALAPLALLLYQIYQFTLGLLILNDPVELIQHRTGLSALILLFITLSVTPLRRLTGWNQLIKFRRLAGLFAFFYATLHAFSYFVFDHSLELSSIWADVLEHPWVWVGFLAFLFLIPLALTSTKGWIRRMGGKNWTRLHMLIYAIAPMGVLHFIWQVKADLNEPLTYGAILAVILAARVLIKPKSKSSMPPPPGHGPKPRPVS
ncbi:MAG: sulfoxide reductase heme-binding subunit YedZ [Bacteroidetes bacterium]|nr:sulfoxide reductase heme-binding subunit YedZ [Bacteroidota bacterium]